MRLVCGIGICDISTRTDNKSDREYVLWKGVLERCYSERILSKHPTYRGCFMSEDWLTYSNFKADIQRMRNFEMEGFQLDKDILIKGNKLYSKNTCCFLPRDINTLVINRKLHRGEYPVGVRSRNDGGSNPFEASCSMNGRRHYLGSYESAYEAFLVYKRFKEDAVKAKANHYKDILGIGIYNALMNWSIEIDD